MIAMSLVVLLVSLAAHAGPAEVRGTLAFSAPEQCPDESAFRRLVAMRLGYDPFDGANEDEELHVSIALSVAGAGARGQVRVARNTKRGSREVTGNSCKTVAESAATIVALAIDPVAATTPPERPPGPPKPPSPPSSAEKPASAPRVREEPSPAPPRDTILRTGAVLAASTGLLPRASAGGGLDVAFGSRPIFVDTLVAYETMLGNLDDPRGGSVGAKAAHVTLGPCVQRRWIVGCVSLRPGVVWARADAVERPVTRAHFVAHAGLRAGIEWALSDGYALRLAFGGWVAMTPVTLWVDKRIAWTAPPLGGDATLTLFLSIL